MQFNQATADWQAKTSATYLSRGRRIHLCEFLENRFEFFRWNGNACVFDTNYHSCTFFRGYMKRDLASLGEFNGVVDEIDHDLAEACSVSKYLGLVIGILVDDE